jgi:L-threonylcarbamoyladenylate synthase
LRLGGVGESRLAEHVGHSLAHLTAGEVAAPGTLPSHYAPNAHVELVRASDVDARLDALHAQGRRVGVLEAPDDLDEYARVLYTRLREADAAGLDVVLAVLPDDEGIGAAIADRLRRAAAG